MFLGISIGLGLSTILNAISSFFMSIRVTMDIANETEIEFLRVLLGVNEPLRVDLGDHAWPR